MADEDNNGKREMGELTAQVKALGDSYEVFRKETREDFRCVFDKLELMSTGGCAVGRRNSERIDHIEKQPERTSAVWANVASIIAAAVAGLAFWKVNN